VTLLLGSLEAQALHADRVTLWRGMLMHAILRRLRHAQLVLLLVSHVNLCDQVLIIILNLSVMRARRRYRVFL
jgi:hypothetical protein